MKRVTGFLVVIQSPTLFALSQPASIELLKPFGLEVGKSNLRGALEVMQAGTRVYEQYEKKQVRMIRGRGSADLNSRSP